MPVVISRYENNRTSLARGYSGAHSRYNVKDGKYQMLVVEGQSDLARVLVQVKRNGGKKGIPFLHIQRGIEFDATTSRQEVYNIVLTTMLEVINIDTQVQGFKFHENDFQLFDSGWIKILSSDITRLTHLLKKGMTHTGTKKGAPGGWKYVQKWAETWYFVLTHSAYQSFELWEAGEESSMVHVAYSFC
ncbi:hypothetical protein EDD18DRAFT_1112565 [Armillaria luteobubalina]|uniref:Uncharacterized protein n=1 Tax=Armillaria luteobubalina TaxID=153913 RepID=A0AA39PEM3_9AGAR|nr:hypothetical protein EDD18DRAFT_1112565 [Armillaria luteobubalina]